MSPIRSSLALFLLALAPSAMADETKIDVKDLPKAVVKAAMKAFPEAKIVGAAKETEDGETIYEVEMKLDGKSIDLAIDDEGEIEEVEKEIEVEDLPRAVIKAVREEVPEARDRQGRGGHRRGRQGRLRDELETKGEKTIEVVFSPNGKVLERATTSEDDDDDKAKKKDKDDDDKGDKKKDKDDDKKGRRAASRRSEAGVAPNRAPWPGISPWASASWSSRTRPRSPTSSSAGSARRGSPSSTRPTARSAEHRLTAADWDLVLLDWSLPEARRPDAPPPPPGGGRQTPVLFLTARDAVGDRVRGLDAGADDYLCKPFAFEELLARVRALVRRPRGGRRTVLALGDVRVDLATHRAERAGKPLDLTAKEQALLVFFLRHPGEVLSRTRIYEHVWDERYDGISNTLEVHVMELRRKLEARGPG